jgi:hypothetical protein
MAEAAQTLFTLQSFATLGGATLGVVVVTNTFRKLTGRHSPWVPFTASVAISILGAHLAGSLSGVGWLLALLNACLLFCTALGLNETVVDIANTPPPGMVSPQGRKPIKWLSYWVKRSDG